MKNNITLYSTGGCGDQILAFRLTQLINQISPFTNVRNICCCREETWNMLETIYRDEFDYIRCSENFLDGKNKIANEMLLREEDEEKYIVWPDLLFRNEYSPPLKEWGITNFLVKQTRTLIGKWKPEKRITINLNSITPNYTYHSIPELVRELGKRFSDKEIYVPLLQAWNNKQLNWGDFHNLPSNVIIDINPDFSKSYDLLCRSEYLITTDSGVMHIGEDLGIPMCVLDPQFNVEMFEARWRARGYYNSIPINALVEDICHFVDTNLTYPETMMIGADKVFRKHTNWSIKLNFKD